MTDNEDPQNMAGELRRRAEKIARKKAPDDLRALSPAVAQKLLQEMRAQQIELEMQNEEMRKAQEKHAEWREQYLELYDAAPVGYFSISEKGAILRANLTAANLLGVARHDMSMQPFTSFIFKEDQDVFYLHSKKLFETGEPQHCRLRIVRRDGTLFWARLDGNVARDGKSGKPVCRATLSDITDRKQVEEALQAERDCARQYLDIAGVIMVGLAPDQSITIINRKGCELLGYSQQELIGKNWFDVILPENERAEIKALFARLIKGELEPIEYVENHVVTRGGEKRLISWHNTLARDPEGNITGSLSSGEDITERRQAEERLKNSEEKFRALYENAPVLIDAFDNNGRCIMWNSECEKVFGWTIDEVNAHDEPLALFYPDPDIRREVIESVTSQPGKIFREWHPLNKDGKELTALWANFRLPNGIVINIGHDITDRKRLEEEQQKVAKLESIGLLAAGIAHNFNNILTMILGNISLAKMDSKPGSENHELLDQAEKASLRAKDLTAQLLTFAKGGAPIKKITSLAELIKDTAGSALYGSNVKCHFSIPADLRQAEIDAVQIRQVLHNLVTNARQAMPAGGTIELLAENMTVCDIDSKAEESMLKAGDYIKISLTDHGSGIPENNMGKLFDPFFTTRAGAIGLGLSTAFSITRRHGGHIRVDSKDGAGSTVYVYLPVAGQSS